jgi:prephenate dehydrogenase
VTAVTPGSERRLENARVTVVGLGLMGASLAGALRGKCEVVVGVARRQETIESATARGLVDEATLDLRQGLAAAHVVILAVPVRAILSLLDEIGSLLPDGCLILDLGSTKAQITAKMAQLPEHVQPLGGHPMCGKEVSGVDAAEPAIFHGATFVLTPLPRTSENALALGTALVTALGSRPLILEARRHDRLVAMISHLPYLLSCSLVSATERVALEDSAVWDVAAGGYRDTSRLAASDVTMMLDILLTNRAAVLDALSAWRSQLRDLADLIESADEDGLRAALTNIRTIRPETSDHHVGFPA